MFDISVLAEFGAERRLTIFPFSFPQLIFEVLNIPGPSLFPFLAAGHVKGYIINPHTVYLSRVPTTSHWK